MAIRTSRRNLSRCVTYAIVEAISSHTRSRSRLARCLESTNEVSAMSYGACASQNLRMPLQYEHGGAASAYPLKRANSAHSRASKNLQKSGPRPRRARAPAAAHRPKSVENAAAYSAVMSQHLEQMLWCMPQLKDVRSTSSTFVHMRICQWPSLEQIAPRILGGERSRIQPVSCSTTQGWGGKQEN